MQNQPTSSNNQEATQSAPIIIHEAEEPRTAIFPVENQSENQPSNNGTGNQSTDSLEPREIPHFDPRASSAAVISEPAKETSIDPSLLDSDPGEESDEGDSSSSL